MRLSRRSLLTGLTSAALLGRAPRLGASEACATLLPAAISNAPVTFTPSSVAPLAAALSGRPRRPSLAPTHLGEGLEQYLQTQRRLARGEITVPPRLAGTRPQVEAAPRLRPLAFVPIIASGAAYDASFAVGRDHVMVAVNFTCAIYAKSGGAPVVPPRALREWFPNTPVPATTTGMVFDPRVLYDVRAERWILVALAWNKRTHEPPPDSTLLLSVSASADPTGLWWSWVLDAGTTAGTYADYPMLAVNDGAVCISWNVYRQPLPARVRVIPKAALYAGGKIPFRDFVDVRTPGAGPRALAVQPCQSLGPASRMHLVNTLGAAHDSLTLWTMEWRADTPALTCENVKIDSYLRPEWAPQRDGAKLLATGDTRIRSAVVSGETVLFAFTSRYRSGGRGSFNAARWYRVATTPARVIDRDELAEDGSFHGYPAVTADAGGGVHMIAGRTSAREFPSLVSGAWPREGIASRALLAAGTGPHLACRGDKVCTPDETTENGWGDYNGISTDPVDHTTVWLCGATSIKDAPKTWTTWIGAVR